MRYLNLGLHDIKSKKIVQNKIKSMFLSSYVWEATAPITCLPRPKNRIVWENPAWWNFLSSTRQRKLSTFYFFANHMKDLLILAMNYFWPRHSFYVRLPLQNEVVSGWQHSRPISFVNFNHPLISFVPLKN